MAEQYTYNVPVSRVVRIGELKMGGTLPVVIQSMTNSDTLDGEASSRQLEKIVDAGGAMVRFTTQGLREVRALEQMISVLNPPYKQIPVVADVHFNADVAVEAAKICHKVRINPGNFTEKKRNRTDFTGEQYREAYEVNKKQLISLIQTCRENHTAIRIGVNHGSLSDRIMSRFGDTPEGMVESALEFLRICHDENFNNVVVSLKSSNTVLMIHSVRLLVKKMVENKLYYPVHLGVTEAGDGMEGRIRSVTGIAPLLLEGMGDTIRVSLTEPPEKEIPVARLITKLFAKPRTLPYHPFQQGFKIPLLQDKYRTVEVLGTGGTLPPVVIAGAADDHDPFPDIIVRNSKHENVLTVNNLPYPVGHDPFMADNSPCFVKIKAASEPEKIAGTSFPRVWILDTEGNPLVNIKDWLLKYYRAGGKNPVILHKFYHDPGMEEYMLRAAGEFALLLVDRLIQGVWVENSAFPANFNNRLAFFMLQASRTRITSTEFIACPSCGRTKFDIQSVLAEVKARTGHLKGLKIAVMGCIVNGPGEMADADYGYIGSGKGKVSIYKGRTEIRKNVPAGNAVESLEEVIKAHGDWRDP